jgi:DNA helicase-2/ATP-dependent DNA helicase PcrA
MTIHRRQGLEFDTVVLDRLRKACYPTLAARALWTKGAMHSLEERAPRADVAITRARRKCFLMHAAIRRIYGQWTSSIPSRFVAESYPATTAITRPR